MRTAGYYLTLSTVTKFFESICSLLPCRNSEFGMMPSERRKEEKRFYKSDVVL